MRRIRLAGIVNSHHLNRLVQLGILTEYVHDLPEVRRDGMVRGDDLDPRQTLAIQRLPQELDPGYVVQSFVPDAAEVDIEAVILLRPANETNNEIGVVLRVELFAIPRIRSFHVQRVGIAGVGKILVANPVGGAH